MEVSSMSITASTVAPSVDVATATRVAPKHHISYEESYYYPHEGNSTLSTSVTIHVTPEHYYLIAWACLWILFVIAIAFGAYQSHKEHQWLTAAQKTTDHSAAEDLEHGGPTAGGTSSLSAPRRGKIVIVGGTRVSTLGTAAGGTNGGTGSDGEAVSSGDMSRTMFRRLLLLAMIARAIAIPVQIYSNPLWVQLIADTFPVMAYASAWTMLVSFFVRLVGVALGSGTSTTPGSVIQITAYCLYSVLLLTFFFHNADAAVLLYSLLCCIYAALLGTSLYFLPKLILLLYPSLMQWPPFPQNTSSTNGTQSNPRQHANSASSKQQQPSRSSPPSAFPNAPPALAIRLALCCGVCLFVFAARTINFANKIVSPAHTASWWWQYGALELFPSILFLIIIQHPQVGGNSSASSGRSKNGDEISSDGLRAGRKTRSFQRTDSYGSASHPKNAPRSETAPLARQGGGGGYGSATGSAQSLKDHGGGRR
ncbi:hypothetical protein IV203_014873 [Nitzschia inconspicua]|uniref:Uncharacterized protein n=1 Tax=Nitzschia inconspicua TaxID=303405 RepID=A0A9K3PSJ1_9STRA|nr:hypothetical protein IV203_014873 [Nitzschia inconspicua]